MLWGLLLMPDSPGWELDVELRTLTPMREPLGCDYFPACELPTQEEGILPVLQKCLPLPSHCLLGIEYLFW